MQVGDLVRFKDISSMCDNGKRMFPEMDGRVGLVLSIRNDKSGNLMVVTDLERRYLRDGLSDRGFNARYYEVVNVTSR
jgi:hypothetical protein